MKFNHQIPNSILSSFCLTFPKIKTKKKYKKIKIHQDFDQLFGSQKLEVF